MKGQLDPTTTQNGDGQRSMGIMGRAQHAFRLFKGLPELVSASGCHQVRGEQPCEVSHLSGEKKELPLCNSVA